ncbi:sensor histidine kinase [Insolitispirillum peregrinum]|uniref:sensor histidine kinase n=1 Tax=Insolitispirillum peregrinum TaxID=80876 RepID=UPI00361952AA
MQKNGFLFLKALLGAFLPILLVVVTGPVWAGTLVLRDDLPSLSLNGGLSVYEDKTTTATIDDVQRISQKGGFTDLAAGYAGGYRTSHIWLRFTVQSESRQPDWILAMGLPFLNYVTLYVPRGDGTFQVSRQGEMIPVEQRDLRVRGPGFRIHLEPGEEKTFFIEVHSKSTISVDGDIWQEGEFHEFEKKDLIIVSSFASLSFYVLLFSVLNLLTKRNLINFSFFSQIVTTFYVNLYTSGLLSLYVFPDMTWPIAVVPFFNGMQLTTNIMLVDCLLRLPLHCPRISKAFRGLAVLGFVMGVIGVIWGNHVTTPSLNMLLLVLIFLVTGLAFWLVMTRGEQGAIIFLVAFAITLAASVPILMRNIGLLPPGTVLPYSTHFVTLCHAMVVGFGLIQQARQTERERQLVQRRLLEESQRSERDLEERIAQRTRALASEIQERRQVEERLRDSERQVRAVLDAASFPMMVMEHRTARPLFINGPAEGVFSGELSLQMFCDHPEIAATLQQDMISQLPFFDREIQLVRKAGGDRWLMVSAVFLRYGGLTAVLFCLNDISQRKELEHSLLGAREQAEHALETERRARREQRNFLAMVSHEFRVPLAIVETATQVLGLTLPPQATDCQGELAKVQRAVARMTDLIETCLADDWLESTSMSLRLETLDLVWLVQDVCEEFAILVDAERMRLHLPEAALLRGDATLLRVVVSNLVDNALKYSPAELPIDVRMSVGSQRVVLEVCDLGKGIAVEEREQIFDKFFRSPSVGRVGGAGLGLYVVRRIVMHHGGTIACVSGPAGWGTVFRVELPLGTP